LALPFTPAVIAGLPIKEALATLNQANNVMTLSSAAHCKATFTEVRHTLGEDEHHDHEEHGGHGEFIVEYHFNCEHIEKLSQIDPGRYPEC
jgi:hypothetical protein